MKKNISFITFVLSFFIAFAQHDLKDNYNLMPWPEQISEQSGHFLIDHNFTIAVISSSNKGERLNVVTTQFLRNVSNKTGVFIEEGFVVKNANASVVIQIQESPALSLGIDESYTLTVHSNKINIEAKTDVGAIYALQTLFQLLQVKDEQFVFPNVTIQDSPRFPWRGLMIDVARHFMPIDVLKRNLDAMASVKMNVFHWHLSDDQGYRVESKKLPLLTQKGSDGLFYTQEQVKDLIKYANERGIRVIPEIDVPGHASAILTAYPEYASNKTRENKIERFAGVFNPTLDPTIDGTYEFLDVLFGELAPLFPDVYFHIGGDENAGKDWDESESIQKFMKQNNLKNNHELQTYFNIKLQKILSKYGKVLMGWDEIMTDAMPKNAIIHSWRGTHEGLAQSTLIEAAQKGYKTVLSNGFYIDRMQPASHHYNTEPIGKTKLTKEEADRILGGEATMWSELVTPLTVDSRIWPRTAAIAERFWSPSSIKDVDNMYTRMNAVSQNLEQIGITHIRNKETILRNVSNYQDITALTQLSNISEPLKVYARNSGGTQYKSYSPFSLFVDACNVDAKDAIQFEILQKKYVQHQDVATKNKLLKYLSSWNEINKSIEMQAVNAPNMKAILPYAKRVSKIAGILYQGLEKDKLSKKELEQIQLLLNQKEEDKDNLDVEFAAKESVQLLAEFLNSQKIKP